MKKDRNEKKPHSPGLQELTPYPESQRTEQADDWTARYRDQEERASRPHVHIPQGDNKAREEGIKPESGRMMK